VTSGRPGRALAVHSAFSRAASAPPSRGPTARKEWTYLIFKFSMSPPPSLTGGRVMLFAMALPASRKDDAEMMRVLAVSASW
jgi:hypothetical protein